MGKISDYTRVLAAKLADVFVVDQTDNGTTETKSATVEQIGTAIGTLQNFADLDTSNKTLVDSINEIASYTPVYGNAASGAIATFDTSLALPLQDLQIAINAVQESGTPTPSTPKLISGFTGANVAVKGANLFSLTQDTIQADRQLSLSACTKNDTSVTATSTANNYACFGRYVFLPKGTYTIKFQATSSEVGYTPSITVYRDGNTVVKTNIQPNTPTTFTLTDDKIVEVRMFVTYNNDANIRTVTFSDIQIEKGNSVSATYTPYVSNITPITWQTEAGTVYGGLLDITSGVLTVTHAITTLDGSQGLGSFRTSAKTGYTQTEWYDYRSIGVIDATIISDKFFSTVGIPTVLYGVGGSPNGERCFFGLPDTVTTPAEANTWFSNNPTVIVYPIATPVTYQLTPTQISAIVGTNNIFTDTNGNTSIMYACSLKDHNEQI